MSATVVENVPANVASRAKTLWYLGNKMTIHFDSVDTGGEFAVIETLAKQGSEPPMHIHANEDEAFIILEGTVKITVNGVETILGPGDSKRAPRGVPHTFRLLTPEARMIGIVTPGGFENFFRSLSEPAEGNRPFDPSLIPSWEQIGKTAAQFGTRLV